MTSVYLNFLLRGSSPEAGRHRPACAACVAHDPSLCVCEPCTTRAHVIRRNQSRVTPAGGFPGEISASANLSCTWPPAPRGEAPAFAHIHALSSREAVRLRFRPAHGVPQTDLFSVAISPWSAGSCFPQAVSLSHEHRSQRRHGQACRVAQSWGAAGREGPSPDRGLVTGCLGTRPLVLAQPTCRGGGPWVLSCARHSRTETAGSRAFCSWAGSRWHGVRCSP